MNIPEIRARLIEIGEQLQAREPELGREIVALAEATRRQPPSRPRAPVKHKPMTKAERMLIADYAQTHPERHLSEIAAQLGTNPGRVSEALREDQARKRFEADPRNRGRDWSRTSEPVKDLFRDGGPLA